MKRDKGDKSVKRDKGDKSVKRGGGIYSTSLGYPPSSPFVVVTRRKNKERTLRMPFGKYRGLPVTDLPPSYLRWLWENIELREPLRSAVREALGLEGSGPLSLSVEPATLQGIYRRLALKWHPDCGGSNEAMAALNEFYEELRELL
ncbi:hypothetical protein DRQ26_06760 [bacterium]|nr:MAG: hypothetical protein DRQ26_06760 [bacterium]